MNKVFFLLLLPFLFSNCKSDDGLTVAFEMEYPNQSFEIPAGLNTIESHFFVIDNIPTNKDFFFGSFKEEDIKSIIPAFARITSLEGNNTDYDFLFEVSIRICAEDNPFNCAREIFWRDQIPANIGNRVDFIPNDIDVKEILTGESFTIEVVLLRLVSPPPTFIDTRIELGFEARR